MFFIHDTRDQIGKHKYLEDWMAENGHTLVRSKMYVGDIALLNDQSKCIDLKGGGLQEVYSNLVQSHDRFRRECIRASEANIQLIILVEEWGYDILSDVKTWKNPRRVYWERKWGLVRKAQESGKMLDVKIPQPPISSERLMGMMNAMSERYGVSWEFCNPEDVGETVYQILMEGK